MLLFSVSAGLSSAWALRSDRNQPIDIRADRVEVDQRAQTSHYLGNVHMQQGSLKIDADDVMVFMQDGKLHKIIINGNPARFQQQPEGAKAVVTSQAQNMEYYAGEEKLLLKHNAEVNQGGNHFHGDFIEYDTRTSTVKANTDENSQSRVHAIIQPGGKEPDESPAPTGAPVSPPKPPVVPGAKTP